MDRLQAYCSLLQSRHRKYSTMHHPWMQSRRHRNSHPIQAATQRPSRRGLIAGPPIFLRRPEIWNSTRDSKYSGLRPFFAANIAMQKKIKCWFCCRVTETTIHYHIWIAAKLHWRVLQFWVEDRRSQLFWLLRLPCNSFSCFYRVFYPVNFCVFIQHFLFRIFAAIPNQLNDSVEY